MAAKTDSTNNSPTAMQGVGASWSSMFNFDSVKKAMDSLEFVETISVIEQTLRKDPA